MKKQWITMGVLAVSLPGLSFAMVDEIFCKYPCGINPGMPPCQECGYTAEVNYLYWKPYQDNNGWANITKPKNNLPENYKGLTNTSKYVATTADLHYDWDSGFRVGLGMDLPCYYWTLGVAWTHFATQVSASANTDFGLLTPYFLSGDGIGSYQTSSDTVEASAYGKAIWNFELNQVDFDLQRELIFGYGITLTPFMGLRAEFLKQKYIIEIFNQTEAFLLDTNEVTNRLIFNYKSFGLKAGFKAHFDLFCGLGFYGQCGLASTYGGLETSQELVTLIKNYSSGVLFNQSSPEVQAVWDKNCLRTSCDLSLGLEWRTLFHCDSSLFFVRCGWEHHTLFDQNNFLSLNNYQYFYGEDMRGGNLYLYGWTFALGGHF